jgi:hypothetical protein
MGSGKGEKFKKRQYRDDFRTLSAIMIMDESSSNDRMFIKSEIAQRELSDLGREFHAFCEFI